MPRHKPILLEDEEIILLPPTEKEEPSRVYTFKAKPSIIEKIDEIAKKRGVSRSEIIREAISLYLYLVHSSSNPDPSSNSHTHHIPGLPRIHGGEW